MKNICWEFHQQCMFRTLLRLLEILMYEVMTKKKLIEKENSYKIGVILNLQKLVHLIIIILTNQ